MNAGRGQNQISVCRQAGNPKQGPGNGDKNSKKAERKPDSVTDKEVTNRNTHPFIPFIHKERQVNKHQVKLIRAGKKKGTKNRKCRARSKRLEKALSK